MEKTENNIVQKDVLRKYNLPEKIVYCKKCVISNQRPRTIFDEEGVCSACRFAEYKKNRINWKERERKLEQLLDKHRGINGPGNFDVIVPCSGGKDSSYVAHMLKFKYNMTPLTVTWSPNLYTEIGWRNLQAFIKSGFDHILFSPNRQINCKLTKAAFEVMGDPFQPFIFGQYSAPFRAAIQYNVSLVFYGEDGEVEYGGAMEYADRSNLPWDKFSKNRFSNIYPKEFEKYGVGQNDLKRYALSEEEMKIIQSENIEQHFFSYYHKWVPQENYYYAAKNCGFQANQDGRSEGTYSKYASLDDKFDGFHYHMMFIKFGIGRATSDAAHEIRDGHILRDEGVALVRKYDGEFPKKYFEDFLCYCDITEDYYWKTVDSWRSPHIWSKVNGDWELKVQVS